MRFTEIAIDTGSRKIIDITDKVREFCRDQGDGLCLVFAPHATAGLALMETGSGSESDLEDTLERLFPHKDIYKHRHGSVGHGANHILPVFVSPSLTVAVRKGVPVLGTWQSIVFVDMNADNPHRRVQCSFVGSPQ